MAIIRDHTAKDVASLTIAVVIPCYRTEGRVIDVLTEMPAFVDHVFCVDDACPEGIGDVIEREVDDTRVKVVRHDENQGVGGATITGYKAALDAGVKIVVKMDGDGQMDPTDMVRIIRPIVEKRADYTKGNRFFRLDDVRQMPAVRIFGNGCLTFMAKFSTGYWNMFDPTNGYTAIHSSVLRQLPLERLHRRYFFESDILFRLSTIRAVVCDVPIKAKYGDERSSLKISNVLGSFLWGHIRNTFKRIIYAYYLRNFQVASIELLFGIGLLIFGGVFGTTTWINSATAGIATPAGTVMLAALPVILGLQLLLAALNYDIASTPTQILHKELWDEREEA